MPFLLLLLGLAPTVAIPIDVPASACGRVREEARQRVRVRGGDDEEAHLLDGVGPGSPLRGGASDALGEVQGGGGSPVAVAYAPVD